MKKIILKAKINFKSELNLKNLSKINFEEKIISKIKMLYDNKEFKLKELFKIQVKKSDKNELIIFGTNRNCDYLGWKWKKGTLIIKSDVGSFLGVQMSNGKIIVEGSCEHHVGSGMTGGKIFLKSNAYDFVGSPLPGSKIGMNGGLIVINGKAGNFLGLQMRRGVIFVAQDVGNNCCNNMIAGTVILKKSFGDQLGLGMKRGSIILFRKKIKCANFVDSGESRSLFINLLNNYLFKVLNLKPFSQKDKFIRLIGDIKMDGMGEIFLKKD